MKKKSTELDLIPNPGRKNEGSLLRLFQSELFDIYFHMYYLYNRSESGIQDYLVNLLFRRSDDEISFYLPQLCCLSVMRYHESTLGRFLLAKASVSMNFALKLSWWFKALADTSNEEIRAISLELHQDVEIAIVNSRTFSLGTRLQHVDFQPWIPDLFRRRRAIEKIKANALQQPSSSLSSTPNSHVTTDDGLKTQAPETITKQASLHSRQFTTLLNQGSLSSLPELSPPVVLKKNSQYNFTGDTLYEKCFTSSDNPSPSEARFTDNESNSNSASYGDLTMKTGKDNREKYLFPSSSFVNLGKPLQTSSSSPSIKCGSKPIKVTISPGFAKWTGPLKVPNSTIRLPSIYARLGSPFSYVSFLDAMSMDLDLQQYIVKQRRCDYYNSVNTFINTLIEVSNQLAREPNHSLRYPILKSFLLDMNEWMFSRRCLIAALKGTFFMTGLMIPLAEFMAQNALDNERMDSSSHSIQIVRFITEECKVLSSKRRAPFLLVFEVADLDEDLDDFNSKSLLDSQKSMFGKNLSECSSPMNLWDKLYIYECILQEVKEKKLYIPLSAEETSLSGTTESPLQALRRCVGLQKKNSLSETPSPNKREHVTLNSDDFQKNSIQDVQAVEVNREDHLTKDALNQVNSTSSLTAGNDISTLFHVNSHHPVCRLNSFEFNPHSTYKTSPEEMLQHAETLVNPSPQQPSCYLGKDNRSQLVYSVNFNSSLTCCKQTAPKEKNNSALPAQSADSELAASARCIRKKLWGPIWNERKKHYRRISPFGCLKSWNLGCVLVKGGDDVRQEMLASQLIKQFELIFKEARIPLYIRPYEVLVTGANSGIMVFVPDTVSFDILKKTFEVDSIAKVFESSFADNPYEAKKNFIESHAAYSLIGYLLQVKDRHNGNYLLDAEGHVIHIDYGYMLSNSPGSVNFESSPFKLTTEFLDIMDGEHSDNFKYFCHLVIQGFLEIRKHAERLLLLVEAILTMPKMPCFLGDPEAAFSALKKRFMLNLAEEICIQKISELIDVSVNNWRSIQTTETCRMQRLSRFIDAQYFKSNRSVDVNPFARGGYTYTH